MEVIHTIANFKSWRNQCHGSVGFVPTMGFLHDGHLSLAKQAKEDNSEVAVSIFVNPTQFGPSEDFKTYPRDQERDLALLEEVRTDTVFIPTGEEMYPNGYCSWVDVEKVTERLEGEYRPGHFRGVTTVVAKLFNIVEPTRAYFGQKDAQQVTVISKMVADLNMNLEVIVVPTMREADGLAMSSRNIYLNTTERKAATILYKALTKAKEQRLNGERDANRLLQTITALIKSEPMAKIDYISVADVVTLEEVSHIDSHALISIAVRFGKTRLIDNILLD
jgi:pantoate--beta-alanine ligase